jgi:hypothetical protein
MKQLVKPGGVLVIHDVRSAAGKGGWLLSGLAAALNGDAVWWLRNRGHQKRALRDAWQEHGAGERYLTVAEVRALCESVLPGARSYWHPLWRYTVVWRRDA